MSYSPVQPCSLPQATLLPSFTAPPHLLHSRSFSFVLISMPATCRDDRLCQMKGNGNSPRDGHRSGCSLVLISFTGPVHASTSCCGLAAKSSQLPSSPLYRELPLAEPRAALPSRPSSRLNSSAGSSHLSTPCDEAVAVPC